MPESHAQHKGHLGLLLSVGHGSLHVLDADVGFLGGEGPCHKIIESGNAIIQSQLLGELLDESDHSPAVENVLDVALENAGQQVPAFVLISGAEVLILFLGNNPLYLLTFHPWFNFGTFGRWRD